GPARALRTLTRSAPSSVAAHRPGPRPPAHARLSRSPTSSSRSPDPPPRDRPCLHGTRLMLHCAHRRAHPPRSSPADGLVARARRPPVGSVRVAIIGVGNCASSLVQGVHYYREAP